MKKIVLVLSTFLLLSAPIFAQTVDDYIELVRDVLKMEKKAVIADAMMFTEAESGPFWELYNEFELAMNKVQNKRIAIIKDFASNYENMTDAKADELWVNSLAYQQELLKLKKSYYGKFKKILPAGKAAKYFQIDNKIETLVNAELALQIPVVEVAQ
jgi:hypothetical protein